MTVISITSKEVIYIKKIRVYIIPKSSIPSRLRRDSKKIQLFEASLYIKYIKLKVIYVAKLKT